jgi:tetratricopeptide (TPR) repeat protein
VRRSRLLLAGTAAALVAAVLLLGGALREDAPAAAGPSASSSPALAERLDSGLDVGSTPRVIARLEAEARGGADAETLTLLGLAYQQRARETADFSYLSRSEGALRRALRLAPRDAGATGALGSLALARHQFAAALRLGRKAHRLAPGTAGPYGIVGDALLELGRYPAAFAAFDRLASLKPGLSAYARVSYARELLGRRTGAIGAMELALDAARGRPEASAWTHVELAKLHFGAGRLDAAARHYRLALRAFPGYVYALDGLAHVEHARGRTDRGIALARRAVEAVPLPQLVGTLADLLTVSGRHGEAQRQLALVGAIERLLVANGVRTDLETAFFDADHGVKLPSALARARAARVERPSILADDVLSWALARNGRCEEAVRYSKRALRLGTQDATLFFHRGYAERCAGRSVEARRWFARALDLNPHFSILWAPVARRALR